jgi:thioredoxin-like negative regulator of GroEL
VVLVGYYQPENKHSLQVLGELDQWAEASREQVKLVRVDASKNMLLSKRYQLNALPLIQVFRQGQLENTLVEKIDYADLEKAITKPAENLAAK